MRKVEDALAGGAMARSAPEAAADSAMIRTMRKAGETPTSVKAQLDAADLLLRQDAPLT